MLTENSANSYKVSQRRLEVGNLTPEGFGKASEYWLADSMALGSIATAHGASSATTDKDFAYFIVNEVRCTTVYVR